MKVINRLLYAIYVISLICFIASILLVIAAGIYKVVCGHTLMFLKGWRVALVGDFLVMMLIAAFLSNQVDKIDKRKEKVSCKINCRK